MGPDGGRWLLALASALLLVSEMVLNELELGHLFVLHLSQLVHQLSDRLFLLLLSHGVPNTSYRTRKTHPRCIC